jgi:Cu/Ag efflux pump CusA
MIALLAEVIVLTQAPGLTAPEIERQVTIPIEVAVGGLGAVESRSVMGLSEVHVRTDSRAEVVERIQRAQLPSGLAPTLAPAIVGPAGWMRYTVASDQFSPIDVRTLQDWQLRRAQLMVPGTGDVAACGGRVERIEVEVDPKRLAALKLSLADVRVDGGRDLREVEDTVLETKRGVRLRDVARVSNGWRPPHCIAFLGGKEVVVGVVQPRIGAPADLTRSVQLRLRSILPHGIVLEAFPVAQELTLRLPAPLAREEIHKLASAIDHALNSQALIEVGSLDDLEESIREVRVLLRSKADVRAALGPFGQVIAPEDAIVRVSGPDLALLDEIAGKLGGKPVARAPHLTVQPDRAALARLGLSAGDLMMHVEAACAGHAVAWLWRGERRVEVVVRLHDACANLPALRIGNVPLASVAQLQQESVPSEIRRAGGVRFVEVRLRERPDRAQIARSIQLPVGYSIVIP